MKKLFTKLTSMLIVPAVMFGLSFAAAVPVAAADNLTISDGALSAKGNGQSDCLFTSPNCANGIFTTITNVLLYLIGAIAVIMLIIGGIRYVVSGGDSSAVQAAKNTILYAIIGIIVAILAYSIVNFVITNIGGAGGTTS